MILEMKVPSPGESIEEVIIAKWLVKDGDYVKKDQAIAEVDSDKATLELPAEASGIISLKAEEGDTVAVGAVVCLIDTNTAKPSGSAPVVAEIKAEEPKEEAPKVKDIKTKVPQPKSLTPKVEEKKIKVQQLILENDEKQFQDVCKETIINDKIHNMKSSVFGRSKNKWKSEQDALLDVLEKQNLTSEQLIAEHDENQYRWRLKQETDSTLGGIVGCLFVIGLIVVGVVFGVDFYDKNFNKNDSVNENSVNADAGSSETSNENSAYLDSVNNSTSDYNNSNDNNRKIICPNCNGTGGDNVKKDCDICEGAGFTRAYVNEWGMQYDKCSNCNGTGKVKVKIPCEVCNGEGRVNEYE
ncbi:biotin/lipoyl-containing protein [Flavobacterium sp.]|jgi:hypothetical protein|uniref:biotin/lipoyl-containing protein n=1 Tax=Flavobacterium sp. TaxID=239 RepID=UPI0037C0D7A1